MKKIFTLISMALVAMSVNAQELWTAEDLDVEALNTTSTPNTNPNMKKISEVFPEDPGADAVLAATNTEPNTLLDFFFEAKTASITLRGISTPNSDAQAGEAWQKAGGAGNNMALDTDLCDPKFTSYVKSKAGNPAIESVEYFYLNSDGDQVGPRYAEVYWTEGCGKVPGRGCYYELTAAASGKLKLGIFVNKGNHATYIVDKATGVHMPAADIDVAVFYQNNSFVYEGSVEEGTAKYLNEGKMPDDFIVQHTNGCTQGRPCLGYLTFQVEAGKTYFLFNPKSQLGIYGFQFGEGGAGISNLKSDNGTNAQRYNLAGQKVSNDFKGVVIENGRKMMVK